MTTTFASNVELKPPLKWAGGKRWLVPMLRELWQPHKHRRLVEPFVGGMAVALGLLPQKTIVNDANEHLVNFYRWLQHGLSIEIPLENDKILYYKHRTWFNELISQGKSNSKEAAELFYYLNRTGFNGLCRFNNKGEFNVPFGRYTTINYKRDFTEYRTVLQTWTLQHGDFSTISIKPDDIIYADPPYDVEFTSYSAGGFDWQDQVRLAEWLALHDVPIIASNQATSRIIELYTDLGFDIKTIAAPRRISCNGDRSPAPEMIAVRKLSYS